jgi:hypothetical protein
MYENYNMEPIQKEELNGKTGEKEEKNHYQ